MSMLMMFRRSMILGACMLAVGLLCSVQVASAAIIVDTPVELNDGGTTPWINTGSSAWYSDGGGSGANFNGNGLIGPPVTQEGDTAIHTSAGSSPVFSNLDVSGGAHTLQAGTYTIYFAVGDFAVNDFNYSDAAGLPTVILDFAGLTHLDASSSSTTEPASGQWELWSYTWNVASTNPNIDKVLSFSLEGTDSIAGDGVNAAFDGVGGLSVDGSGFLVDFEPIPEPSTLALGLVFGLAGLMRRRS